MPLNWRSSWRRSMMRRLSWGYLARARGGNVAVTFALAAFPLLLFTGAVINYGFATRLQAKLQAATDATALTLCQTNLNTTAAQLQAQAVVLETGYMGATSGLTIDPLGLTSNPRQITLQAHVPSPAVLPKVVGLSSLPVSASSQCSTPMPATFEIAFVLDNTGSMTESSGNQSKLQAVQQAASTFIDYVKNNGAFSSSSRMSIVPFAATVAVNPSLYSTAHWVDTAGLSSYHWTNIDKTAAHNAGFVSRLSIFNKLATVQSSWAWGGCFEMLPYPQNVQDGAPTSNDTLYVPYLAPDEPGPGSTTSSCWTANATSCSGSRGTTYTSYNSYIDDGGAPGCAATSSSYTTAENQACKYVTPTHAQPGTPVGIPNGPNFQCVSKPLQRLTTDSTALKTLINSLTAAGSTNIGEGLMWGWRTLSPYSVFADGAPYGGTTKKVIILMTDGTNQWLGWGGNPNQSLYFPLGYLQNADGTNATARLPTGYQTVNTDSQRRAALDDLTQETCTNAKAAGISIYTIGFSIPSDPIDSQGIQLLQNCATSPKQAFVANNSDGLISAFSQIAQSIGALRISQ